MKAAGECGSSETKTTRTFSARVEGRIQNALPWPLAAPTTYIVHQNGETLEHRLDADKNEHHAADNLRAIAQQMAEALADGQRHNAAEERRDTDNAYRGRYGDAHCAQAHAHGERIDAAGHGQGKHMLPIELGGLLGVFLIFFEGFVNHVAADEHQQGEDDPMVELGYVFAECRCREIAENREQHLESAEPEGAFHGVLYSYAGYGQAFANGYGECIHSYGNRNKQDLNDYRNHGVTEGSSPDYRAMGLDQRSYTPPTPS